MRKWLRKRWVRVGLLTLALYLGSYVALSCHGEYYRPPKVGEIWFTYLPREHLLVSETWRDAEWVLSAFYLPAYQLERALGTSRLYIPHQGPRGAAGIW